MSNPSIRTRASGETPGWLEGNCNNDGIINALDFSILAASYLKSTGESGFDARADFDINGTMNALDFTMLAANYQKSSPREVL